VPKRAMDLMSGEVDRLLLLASGAIIPVPYLVPRKVFAGIQLGGENESEA
jgi:coronin-7